MKNDKKMWTDKTRNAKIKGGITGLEICGSNGSKCYHVFTFATGMLMWYSKSTLLILCMHF